MISICCRKFKKKAPANLGQVPQNHTLTCKYKFSCLSSNLSIATNQIFGASQLRQGHGSASMELLGADANFRTKAKFVAVSEASGSIHIHRCCIHSSRLLPSKCSRIQLPVYSIRPAARFVYVFVLNGYKPLLNDLKVLLPKAKQEAAGK